MQPEASTLNWAWVGVEQERKRRGGDAEDQGTKSCVAKVAGLYGEEKLGEGEESSGAGEV